MRDNALSRIPKKLIELNPFTFNSVIEPHITNPFYQFASKQEEYNEQKKIDLSFLSAGSLWEQVIYKNLKRTDLNIGLRGVFLFEWFPRSPGLYFTRDARQSRKRAAEDMIIMEDGTVAFGPTGKSSMLDGGVGCIRLKPITIDGSKYFMLSASSESCEQGFPLAVPEFLYNEFIDQISEKGAVLVDIMGSLLSVPNEINGVFSGYRGVPKKLLKVDTIIESENEACRNQAFDVSVAVSFRSDFKGYDCLYSSYASFDPSEQGSFEQCISWLEGDYIEKRYQGRIVTDFDETIAHFEGAAFSLSKVMKLDLKQSDLDSLPYHFDEGYLLKAQSATVIYAKTLYMDNKKITVSDSKGVQIVATSDASGANISQSQTILSKDIDMDQLINELAAFKAELKRNATDDDHDIEIGNIAAAEKAAKDGDKSKALEFLSKAGKWTIEILTKTGTSLGAALLKELIIPR